MIPEKLTIKWLRENYQKGTITPKEVLDEIVKRAKSMKQMNIFIVDPEEMNMESYLDNLGDMDFEKKPLWGIPFAVKDNIDLKGYETTAACPAFGYKPEENATVPGRLIAAGAIPIGKTNLDQFATGLVGTRSPYGEVHNSLKEEMISGGSSAGSAVAVAKGLAALALGTDTAGSGRIPAALNNLVGYKPTVGAWPLRGVVPACASLDCVTVFANNLSDALEADQVVRGLDEKDPWSKEVIRKESAKPETIFIPKQPIDFYGPFAAQYEAAWKKSCEMLEKTGIPVEYVDTSFYQEAALLLYGGPCVAERWSDLGKFIEKNGDKLFPVTKTILESGNRPDYTAEYLYQTLHKLTAYRHRSNLLLENGVLVFPTCAGTYSRNEVREDPIETNNDMGRYTNHCNLLDMCAVAVPTIFADDKMPFGVTLFSTATNEHLICAVAEEIEKSCICEA